ncbi:MAG: response regulator [Desulfobacteraceae bacterium]|nr:MAG: response regulator [Desulfobacteraceae bacterium]
MLPNSPTYKELQQKIKQLEKVCAKRKVTEEELLKVKKLESIAALSGGIAHDYNNLLTSIMGNISLAQTYLEPDHEVFALLDEAQHASMLAKDLTQKLITFSKGGAPIKKPASISDLTKRATEFSLSGSNVKYKFHISEELWPVEIDETQIGQAIYNLIMNARDAMSDGGTISVSAENVNIGHGILTLKKGKYVKISFEDKGTGIPKKHIENIFDPYFSTKEMGAQKGMGLGLSICHSIIKGHGGDVGVESQEGVGTTFSIYLPASDAKMPEYKPDKKHMKETPVFGNGRILVMDDEKMIRDLAGGILKHLGYEVEFSKNGAEAIEVYKEAMKSGEAFSAVVLDLTVRGGMGGKEAIRKLMEIDPEVIGIVSSGYSDDAVMTDFEKYGFRGVVAKPYSVREVSETLANLGLKPAS